MNAVTAADRATAARIGLHSPHCLGGDPCTCDATATIAKALAAERAKALAPLLALADELEREAGGYDDEVPTTIQGIVRAATAARECRNAADRIRAAAGPNRTAGEETL